MNNADKIYLLMEILGHDVSKKIDARYKEIIEGSQYEQVFKDLWLMRVQQSEEAQHITQRVDALKSRQVENYYDVASLAREVEVVQTKGNEQIVINPYIYNSYREYPIKSVGELKIPYAKTTIDINEYIMGAEIASEKKIRFLTNFANEWYAITSLDISRGIVHTTENIKKLDTVKRFRFPFLTFMQIIIVSLLLFFVLGVLFSENDLYEQMLLIKPKRDWLRFSLGYSFLLLGFLSLLSISILKNKGKNYHLKIENQLQHNLERYQNLLGVLAKRHDFMLNSIEKSVNNRTFLRLSFAGTGVITPTSYNFDDYNFNKKLISKKEYSRKTKKLFLLSVFLFIISLAAFVATGLSVAGVF